MGNVECNWPVPLEQYLLPGANIHLEPLTKAHIAELLVIGSEKDIWRFLTTQPDSPEDLSAYVEELLQAYQSGGALPFAVRRVRDHRVVGVTRLKNLSRENRSTVVGSWFAPAAWGTGANSEAKLLLLGHAFERLGCYRVEFHVDSRNQRSRTSLTRLGMTEEGTLRSYIITKDGYRRNSVIFSVLDTEWPSVKNTITSRLRMQKEMASRRHLDGGLFKLGIVRLP